MPGIYLKVERRKPLLTTRKVTGPKNNIFTGDRVET